MNEHFIYEKLDEISLELKEINKSLQIIASNMERKGFDFDKFIQKFQSSINKNIKEKERI